MILGEGSVAEHIKQWRINMGLTMSEAARASGISASQWGRIESGASDNPTMTTVIKMFTGMGALIEVNAAPKEPKWLKQYQDSE